MSEPVSPSPEGPLVTFALFAYNQEKYIREAVEGAFAQTYSPLEIILSDDCSTDRTFEIMEEMAANYQGLHKIVLNRNARNLGIGAHLNRLHQLSGGEFFVIAAGDDISVPSRVMVLVKELLKSNSNHLLYSDCEKINNDGSHQSFEKMRVGLDYVDSFVRHDEVVLGAVCSWRRSCFDVFGPLLETIHHEDAVIPFRAAMLGGLAHVPEYLVKYRVLAGSTVAGITQPLRLIDIGGFVRDLPANVQVILSGLKTTAVLIEQKQVDLRKMGGKSEWVAILGMRGERVQYKIKVLEASCLFELVCLLVKCRTWDLELAKIAAKRFLLGFLKVDFRKNE